MSYEYAINNSHERLNKLWDSDYEEIDYNQ